MTFEQLNNANKEIKTIEFKGKQYAEVNQRVKVFRMLFPNGGINTDIISLEDGICVMKAVVTDDDGKILATGTAYEREDSSYINKTSFIENCETSAVGRALGMLGIGIDTSIASADEVENAVNNQGEKVVKSEAQMTISKVKVTALRKRLENNAEALTKYNINEGSICNTYGLKKLEDMTETQHTELMMTLKKVGA